MPIKRLGNGYYIFGTRKIYAKILNGKLVIRVGGGYMIIEEFINTYAEQELTKLNKIKEQQEMLEDIDDVESLDIHPGTRGGSRRSGSGRVSGKSPRTGTGMQHSGSVASSVFTGAVESSVSGTMRNRRIS